jgi:hypothetical protein
MKKLLLIVLLNLSILFLNAQKKLFFESVEINGYGYFESMHFTTEGWLKQFSPAYPPFARKPDSLNHFQSYRGFKDWGGLQINAKGGYGLQLRGLKPISVLEKNNSELLWKTGVGYHTFEGSDHLYYTGSMLDTTKTYLDESEGFQFRQKLIDIYNAVVYSPHIGLLHVSIGLGFQTSFSISSEIREHYIASQYRWNSSPPYWNPTAIADERKILPAKNTMIYSLTVPFGWGIDLSKRVSYELGGEYFHARRSPQLTEKKFSNGAMLQLSFRYKL